MTEPITRGQQKMLHSLLSREHLTRDEQLAYYARVTGTEVTSSMELTKWWATQIIEDLLRAERGEKNLLWTDAAGEAAPAPTGAGAEPSTASAPAASPEWTVYAPRDCPRCHGSGVIISGGGKSSTFARQSSCDHTELRRPTVPHEPDPSDPWAGRHPAALQPAPWEGPGDAA